jgi:hypothetical protein
MAYDYSELVNNAKQWAQQAVVDAYLEPQQVAGILELDQRNPQSLFYNADLTGFKNLSGLTRPLIVAFMGGTGVGKSSLLNRLAGSAIAKVGIERPTSREVTLYHHQSVVIAQLPDNLPLEKITIAQHTDEVKKNIIWIDMPDLDSTELSNKNLVLQWLPHIDVLIYVVSPERYRDNKAWQLLLAEGARHGWLFVLNQWDRGQLSQYEDFKQQLGKAGFEQPLIFRTICDEWTYAVTEDEFQSLFTTIESLASSHTIQQLECHGAQVKAEQLKQQLQHCAALFPTPTQFAQLLNYWQQQWAATEKLFEQGFAWGLQQFANRYARSHTDVMVKPQPLLLWDEWAQSRFNDVLDELALTAQQLNIPAALLKAELVELRQKAGKIIHHQTELNCRMALVKPGNALHRGLLKLVAVCAVLFPLIALSIVAYQVFHGYYDSYVHFRAYLGVDFVAHSALLVAVSWLLPYFFQRNMQPSLEKAALKGLKKGLAEAMLAIDAEVRQAIATQQQQQQALLLELNAHIAACDMGTDLITIEENSTLARMVVD